MTASQAHFVVGILLDGFVSSQQFAQTTLELFACELASFGNRSISSSTTSAHRTALVREFLEWNPHVRFHFTPTDSSWLNQVELWFAKIERAVIARGVFTSVGDLAASFAAT